MQRNARGMYKRMQIPRGKQGNAGECEGNVREWRQSARGMQWNAGEYREMHVERMEVGSKRQGNAGECRGMPGEHVGVGV